MQTRTIDIHTVRVVLHLCRISQREARQVSRPWHASLGAVSRKGWSEIAALRPRHIPC